MAEIHVQTKKKAMPLWIWLVLILLVLGVLAYVMVMRSNKTGEQNTKSQSGTTSFIHATPSNQTIQYKIV